MGLFLEGISFGLVLAILLGPIFIVTIHTAIEKGRAAGFMVTSGVWISDLVFIAASYFFVSKLDDVIKGDDFDFWMSIIGGVILCVFGVVAMLKKSTFTNKSFDKKISLKSFSSYFIKGLLVNTVNPFTFVFWFGVMSSNVIGRDLDVNEALTFVGAIFITILVTDSLKVLLAEVIRKRMNQNAFNIVTKLAGVGLLGFGIYMLFHGLVN